MSLGITSYSIYIPRHRLPREIIAAAWGSAPSPGCKAVCHYDEDTLTMAQSAAWQLLQAGSRPQALFFASTTAPYWQRSPASLIAAWSDLPPKVRTADFGGSLRSGTTALRAACDAVRAGSASEVLVIASEARQGAPESAEEMLFGDAAAAVTVGSERVVAELIDCASRHDDFLDEWRRDTDPYVNSSPSKFSLSRGYEANVVAVGRAVLERGGLDARQVSRAALASPDGRAHLSAAKALGIAPPRVEDAHLADIGVTGAAMPLLLLAQALDRAAPGDSILLIGYGDGADAFLFRVTDAIERLPRPLLHPDGRSISYPSYSIYRKLRDFLRTRAGGPEISNVLWNREEAQNLRLHGTYCPRCGTMQFPIARVCSACRNREGLAERALARHGRLFTFTKDFLYEAPVQPTVMAVVDLEGGGRFLCQLTDIDEREVEIGMEVELVLRRMRESASAHHYYWKCRPR